MDEPAFNFPAGSPLAAIQEEFTDTRLAELLTYLQSDFPRAASTAARLGALSVLLNAADSCPNDSLVKCIVLVIGAQPDQEFSVLMLARHPHLIAKSLEVLLLEFQPLTATDPPELTSLHIASANYLSKLVGSLHIGQIRKSLSRCFSIATWQSIPDTLRQQLLSSPSLQKAWTSAQKKNTVNSSAAKLFPTLLTVMAKTAVQSENTDLLVPLVRLFTKTIATLPTRQFLNKIIITLNLPALLSCSEILRLHSDLLDLFYFYVFFPIDDETGVSLNQDEYIDSVDTRIIAFQTKVFQAYKDASKPLASLTCSSFHDQTKLHGVLSTYDTNTLKSFLETANISTYELVNLSGNLQKYFVMNIFSQHFSLHTDFLYKSFEGIPTRPSLITLSPGIQYLSIFDTLSRLTMNLNDQIYKEVDYISIRLSPLAPDNLIQLHDLSIIDTTPPPLGSDDQPHALIRGKISETLLEGAYVLLYGPVNTTGDEFLPPTIARVAAHYDESVLKGRKSNFKPSYAIHLETAISPDLLSTKYIIPATDLLADLITRRDSIKQYLHYPAPITSQVRDLILGYSDTAEWSSNMLKHDLELHFPYSFQSSDLQFLGDDSVEGTGSTLKVTDGKVVLSSSSTPTDVEFEPFKAIVAHGSFPGITVATSYSTHNLLRALVDISLSRIDLKEPHKLLIVAKDAETTATICDKLYSRIRNACYVYNANEPTSTSIQVASKTISSVLSIVHELCIATGHNVLYAKSCDLAARFLKRHILPDVDSLENSLTDFLSQNCPNGFLSFLNSLIDDLEILSPVEFMKEDFDPNLFFHIARIAVVSETILIRKANEFQSYFKNHGCIVFNSQDITEQTLLIALSNGSTEQIALLGTSDTAPEAIDNTYTRSCKLYPDNVLDIRPMLTNQAELTEVLVKLCNNVEISDRKGTPNAGFLHTCQFIDVDTHIVKSEIICDYNDFQNPGEADYVVSTYQYMRLLGYPASEIAIFCGYPSQLAMIENLLLTKCASNELFGRPDYVGLIQDSNGLEHKFVLASTTRTSDLGWFGDLNLVRKLFYSATKGLYIFGRFDTLKTDFRLSDLVNIFEPMGLKLTLAGGEMYPCSRKASVPAKQQFTMEGPDHLAAYVQEMTQRMIVHLKKTKNSTTIMSMFRKVFPKEPTWTANDIPDLSGKVYIVTGGNAGIGLETVKRLAEHGAKVYMAARSEERAAKAIESIGETKGSIEFHYLDLCDITEIKKSALFLLSKLGHLNGLILNAGVMSPAIDKLTKDNFDLTFGVNVIGHEAFLRFFLDKLKETAKTTNSVSRLAFLSSMSHERATKINYNLLVGGEVRDKALTALPKTIHSILLMDKQLAKSQILYEQSKLGNAMQADYYSRKLGPEVAVVSIHPGVIDTGLFDNINKWVSENLLKFVFHSTEYGALSTLYISTVDDETAKALNGKYLIPWCIPSKPTTVALSVENQEKLISWLNEILEPFDVPSV
ncbi:hypothetical protein CANCADRAFT_3977 [Tortispora caseinolytica NRRL Y-17796]|uniref:RNA helicase aquarius N-terminal domain-containing protein n=1 Tax=Tortispora caseinolytica NRRL Y-17796 TaxID=767744 RepID=A0A1E4TC83_9ASCO|nr:hypothetical protein CANCADRAFT_3977 [Tortispora caseinolytica NRRL Y-17796]